MGRSSTHSIGTALFILVIQLIVSARIIGTPCTKAVHRLSTTLRRALLVCVCVRASKTVVGRNCTHGIGSATSVLVVVVVVEARAIGTPTSNTVHRLTAALSDTGDLAIIKWTFLTIQVSLGGHLVRSAALILMAWSCKQRSSVQIVEV